MLKRWPHFIAFVFALGFPVAGTTDGKTNLNIVTYLPPPGLVWYLNETASGQVQYNDSAWLSLFDADLIIYFMSSFENRYEIPEFGSEILDTIDFDHEKSAIVTQSVSHDDRVIYVVFISANEFDRFLEKILCSTANTVGALASSFSDDFKFEICNCN